MLPIALMAMVGSPGPQGDAMRELVAGTNRFAFDLQDRLRVAPGNLVFSPASISTALAMTSLGARGPTREEMIRTLHLTEQAEAISTGFASLINPKNPEKRDAADRLRSVNALWGQEGLDYRADFLEEARAGFGAGLRTVDFLHAPEVSRLTINAWVEEQTGGRIKDLLAPPDVTKETDLVLTNAIAFKAAWADPFPKGVTRPEPFEDDSGVRPVPTMHQTRSIAILETETFQAIELPYSGGSMAMVVFLPRAKTGLADLEAKMTGPAVEGWLPQFARRQVEVALPRFRVETSVDLVKPLAALGMKSVFLRTADFSGIATDRRLRLSAVVHKAFVEVDEAGTEAAAATGVVGMRIQAFARPPEPPVVFRADHPFLFLIRDRATGSILFLGRVTRPEG